MGPRCGFVGGGEGTYLRDENKKKGSFFLVIYFVKQVWIYRMKERKKYGHSSDSDGIAKKWDTMPCALGLVYMRLF